MIALLTAAAVLTMPPPDQWRAEGNAAVVRSGEAWMSLSCRGGALTLAMGQDRMGAAPAPTARVRRAGERRGRLFRIAADRLTLDGPPSRALLADLDAGRPVRFELEGAAAEAMRIDGALAFPAEGWPRARTALIAAGCRL